MFIFGRAFLGFGAAGLLQGALAIIGYVVRLDKVPLFQGIVVSSLGISVCIGPVLGGVLTDRAGWSMYSCAPPEFPIWTLTIWLTRVVLLDVNTISNSRSRNV